MNTSGALTILPHLAALPRLPLNSVCPVTYERIWVFSCQLTLHSFFKHPHPRFIISFTRQHRDGYKPCDTFHQRLSIILPGPRLLSHIGSIRIQAVPHEPILLDLVYHKLHRFTRQNYKSSWQKKKKVVQFHPKDNLSSETASL